MLPLARLQVCVVLRNAWRVVRITTTVFARGNGFAVGDKFLARREVCEQASNGQGEQ